MQWYAYQNKRCFFVCLYLGHIQRHSVVSSHSVLRNHSWQVWGTCDAEDRTNVSFMQGKCTTHSAIALAPERIILDSNSCPSKITFPSCLKYNFLTSDMTQSYHDPYGIPSE